MNPKNLLQILCFLLSFFLIISNSMAVEKYYFHINDHLGNCRVIVDEQGEVEKAYDYYPFGNQLRVYQPGEAATFTFTGKQLDEEGGLEWYYFGARFYDPEIGRFLTTDPLSDMYPSWNPYHYSLNNPVSYYDLDGRSTVTDSAGNVIFVNPEDDDLSVYRTYTTTGGLNELGMGGGPMSVKEKVGETEFLDEFIVPEGPEGGMAKGRIIFNKEWNGIIDDLHSKSKSMNLIEIAQNSLPEVGMFDIKSKGNYAPHGPMTGRLLNGKYATARSAGNYLAGYNVRYGTISGFGISWDTFMKMAGAVHTGNWSKINAVKILLFGRSYGPPPWYGEIEYAGRRIKAGWNK